MLTTSPDSPQNLQQENSKPRVDRLLGLLLGIGHAIVVIIISLFLTPFIMYAIFMMEFLLWFNTSLQDNKFFQFANHVFAGIGLFGIALLLSIPVHIMVKTAFSKTRPALATNFWQATVAGISAFYLIFIILFFTTDFLG